MKAWTFHRESTLLKSLSCSINFTASDPAEVVAAVHREIDSVMASVRAAFKKSSEFTRLQRLRDEQAANQKRQAAQEQRVANLREDRAVLVAEAAPGFVEKLAAIDREICTLEAGADGDVLDGLIAAAEVAARTALTKVEREVKLTAVAALNERLAKLVADAAAKAAVTLGEAGALVGAVQNLENSLRGAGSWTIMQPCEISAPSNVSLEQVS